MAGFYSDLFTDNDGDLYFDTDVLLYNGISISSLSILPDGGTELLISLGNCSLRCVAYYEQGVIVIKTSQLILLPELEQNLIIEYEQCPIENPENPGRRIGVTRPRKALP